MNCSVSNQGSQTGTDDGCYNDKYDFMSAWAAGLGVSSFLESKQHFLALCAAFFKFFFYSETFSFVPSIFLLFPLQLILPQIGIAKPG